MEDLELQELLERVAREAVEAYIEERQRVDREQARNRYHRLYSKDKGYRDYKRAYDKELLKDPTRRGIKQEKQKDWYNHKRQTDAEFKQRDNEKSKAWREANPETVKESHKKAWEKLKSDPVKYQEHLEKQRHRHRKRKERANENH